MRSLLAVPLLALPRTLAVSRVLRLPIPSRTSPAPAPPPRFATFVARFHPWRSDRIRTDETNASTPTDSSTGAIDDVCTPVSRSTPVLSLLEQRIVHESVHVPVALRSFALVTPRSSARHPQLVRVVNQCLAVAERLPQRSSRRRLIRQAYALYTEQQQRSRHLPLPRVTALHQRGVHYLHDAIERYGHQLRALPGTLPAPALAESIAAELRACWTDPCTSVPIVPRSDVYDDTCVDPLRRAVASLVWPHVLRADAASSRRAQRRAAYLNRPHMRKMRARIPHLVRLRRELSARKRAAAAKLAAAVSSKASLVMTPPPSAPLTREPARKRRGGG